MPAQMPGPRRLPDRIAFVKLGSFSHTNEHVERILTREFPGFRLEVFAVQDFLPSDAEVKTPAGLREIQASAARNITPETFAFSFQTQSLFDASAPGVPHFVYTDHTHLANLQYPDFPRAELNREWITVEKEIYQNASLNFTMSRNIARSICEDYSCAPSKVAVVGAGASAPPALAGERGRYWNKHILFVGLEWERKGGPVLVDAFREVLKAHPDTRLTIVGSSPDVDVPNCEVLGKLPLAEVSRHYGEASIFCLPTKVEPFGIAFLEAMMNRLPIVATRIGAIPEIVTPGKNGLLVEPNTPGTLAQALIDLLDQPERCLEMGESGYHIALRDYTWARVGQKIREHIEEVIGGP